MTLNEQKDIRMSFGLVTYDQRNRKRTATCRLVDEDGTEWSFSSPPRYGSAHLVEKMTRQRNEYIAEGDISRVVVLRMDH